MVPAGTEITLKPGQAGYITQALGGSFTLYVEGNLYRSARRSGRRNRQGAGTRPDAAAERHRRGHTGSSPGRRCAPATTRKYPINIVDLGLVYECEVEAKPDGTRTVRVKMTLTAPGCGMGEVLVDDVQRKAAGHSDGAAKPTSIWSSIRRGTSQ